ncbi:MAG TPA: protein kinase, partial [Vicinamibacteria bacterium]|nr:protein kinase [Vicinamibacteria bacterium]
MGVVYRATDPLLGRSVAIKAINEAYIENLGISAGEYYERFRREAEVAGGLNHPHIVKIFDLGPDYIVMELVEGQSLHALLQARTRFTLSRILEMVAQVASALDAAHAQGIVHRDIKPANIMMRSNGSVTVMDFGLARIESSTLTAAGEILGSASYMAPEVVLGARADARSDIFALGVVAYELMTGERPFAGPSITSILYKIVQEPAPSAHGVDLNVPPDYDDIFAKVLAKEAAARYPRAGDFASELALKKWADRDPVLALRGEPAPVPAPPGEVGDELPSPLDALVPLVVPPPAEAEEPEAATFIMHAPGTEGPQAATEEPAATTFIMQGPEAENLAPAPGPPTSSAAGETTAVIPALTVPPRAQMRVELSGESTWGPASRHPKAAERTAKLRARRAPAEDAKALAAAPPLDPAASDGEATLIVPPPRSAEASGEATLIVPPPRSAEAGGEATLIVPPPKPAITGPDDTGPLGVPLPPIPAKVSSAAPTAKSPDDTGPVGPATVPLPVARPQPAGSRRPSPALLLGGIAALLLLVLAAVAGVTYLLLRPAAPVAEAPSAPPGPIAPAQGEDLPPPEAEVPKSTPPEVLPPPATTEAPPVPSPESAPATPEPPAPSPEPTVAAADEPATLLVASQPSGARVRVGKQSATTPSRLTLQPGRVTLEVEKDGFRPWRKRLTLASGRTQRVTARLQPAPPPRSASPAVKAG